MLGIRQLPPLPQILEEGYRGVDAERELELQRIAAPMIVLQEHPCLAMMVLSGVFVPPHQRIISDVAHRGATSNVLIGSRGTSKTSIIDVLYANVKALLWAKRKGVLISGSSGFRGGQLIFNDTEAWINAAWVDQEADVEFFRASNTNDKLIYRAQNFWQIDYTSLSHIMTVPTNDPAKLRGIRGTELYVDEANFAEAELVDTVASSFLNVLQDMKTGGDNAQANVVYYTTTVDYAWRDFHKTATAAYEVLRAELELLTLQRKGQWEQAADLEKKKKLHRSSYVCIDYTDIIVRRFITTRDGRRMEVVWPDPERRWRLDPNGLPFTERDDQGRMRMEGSPVEIISTYPINREDMEGKLLSGESSLPVWLSEQRNVVDSSAGDVYSHFIVDNAVCKAHRYLIPWEECGPTWQKLHPDRERHYKPTVMWSCTDPCVLGVDYAPGNRDFCALVVIRIGPLADGDFDPATGLGRTPWSNVVWAEQHRNASGRNIAEKIFALAERFNLAYYHDPYETDDWKMARAVGLDCRGGGNAVRDELVYINDERVPDGAYRIYDPLDPDDRVKAFKTDANAKPMLDAIMPTGQLNDKLVEFTLGQMTQRLLYLPADLLLSDRPADRKYDIAFDSARILEHQLRALQQQPTPSGYRKFYMKGDENDPLNKKDFWASFCYAAKQLRAHLLRAQVVQSTPLPMGAAITRFNAPRGFGRTAAGAKAL